MTHGIRWLYHQIEQAAASLKNIEGVGPMLSALTPSLPSGLCGLIAGALVLPVVAGARQWHGKSVAGAAP